MTAPSERSSDDFSRAAAGQGETIDRVFRQERSRLLRYFRLRVASREKASDLVQESFLRLLRATDLAALGNPAAYLQRIARNLLIDTRRREAARPIELSFDDRSDLAARPSQEDALAFDDLIRRYDDAVAELSEKTRDVFLLHRVEGLTYRQIRDKLGISMGTVEYHMMRAIAHLDEALDRA